MSPSTHVVKRRTKSDGLRYQVRFRWRPTDRSARYFATFKRRKDADAAEAWVMTEIGQGRYPDPARYFAEPEMGRSVAEQHTAWLESRRHKVGESAKRIARQALAHFGPLGDMDPHALTWRHCQRWIDDLLDEPDPLKPSTVSAYLSVLRQVLDDADLSHPNPARDKRILVGRAASPVEIMDPPSFAHMVAVRDEMPDKHRSLFVFLERTGMRISEALAVTWGDLDLRDDLIRVKGGKTRAAQRRVPLLPVVLFDLRLVPADETHPDRPIFRGLTSNSMRSAMRGACQRAGVPTYTPHDLRHRYISLLVMGGVPAPLIGKIVGHTKTSVTIDTYAHVLMDEPLERLRELREAAFTVPAARVISGSDAEIGDSSVTASSDREGSE